jgi:ferredoxin
MKWTRPSTRAFAREAERTPGYSRLDWLHGYVYARWPYLYIGVATREHPLARVIVPIVNAISRLRPSLLGLDGNSAADTYHGKVVPLEAARQLVTVDQEIELRDLEHIIPYAKARDIILNNPDHIVALDCPCRLSRQDPCRPVDVCLIIGEPFAGFVVEHHPGRARWISPQEAEDILQAEHDRGHVSHAFFKDAMLNRFYAICNCCACCCGAMQAWQNGSEMLTSSGYVAQVDGERCIGCGTCVEFCQFQALSLEGDRVLLDWERCM